MTSLRSGFQGFGRHRWIMLWGVIVPKARQVSCKFVCASKGMEPWRILQLLLAYSFPYGLRVLVCFAVGPVLDASCQYRSICMVHLHSFCFFCWVVAHMYLGFVQSALIVETVAAQLGRGDCTIKDASSYRPQSDNTAYVREQCPDMTTTFRSECA